MIFKEEISALQAEELFNDGEKVMKFVADIKWEKGFECRSCGHTNYCEGKTPHSRRCTRCKKEESATAHTIFHNIKFPLNKAFFIAYNVCVLGNEFSLSEPLLALPSVTHRQVLFLDKIKLS